MERDLPGQSLAVEDRIGFSLAKIVSAAASAQEFISGMSLDEFSKDRKTVFAVTRALELIGEAAEEIPEDFRDRNPSLPWTLMIERRKDLLHDYYKVDLNLVWTGVTEGLPAIEFQIRGLLSKTQL